MDWIPPAAAGPLSAHRRRALARPPFETIALLLQGGGALGSYQAGVYAALAEAELHPDWVAGISIGAINAALIAGNAPERRRPAQEILGADHSRQRTGGQRLAWPPLARQ